MPRAAEELVRSLVGVKDAHVHTAPDGSLETIDVIAEAPDPPAQLSADVASALIAVFGISMDLQRIRVGRNGNGGAGSEIQTASKHDSGHALVPGGRSEGTGEEPRDDRGSKQQLPRCSRNPKLLDLDILSVCFVGESSTRSCHVAIRFDDQVFTAAGSVPDIPCLDHELAARVAVWAVHASQFHRSPIELADVKTIEIGGAGCVVVAIRFWEGIESACVVGASVLGEDAALAACTAALVAIRSLRPSAESETSREKKGA